MATVDKIRDIIVTSLKYDGALPPPSQRIKGGLTDDFPLIDSHVIDSLVMVKLVSALVEHFRVEIDDQNLVTETFGTIDVEVIEFPRTPTGKLKRFGLRGDPRNQRS
jgi:acyl carrier protein